LCLHELGALLAERPDRDRARAAAERAEVLYRRLGNQAKLGAVAHLLGNIAFGEGKPKQAKQLYERALRLRTAGGDPNAGQSRTSIGTLCSFQGDYATALGHFEAVLETPTDATVRADACAKAAKSLAELGRHEPALEYSKRALAELGKLHAPRVRAGILSDLAWVHYLRGEYDRASQLYRRCLREDSRQAIRFQSRLCLAYVHQVRGEFPRAIEMLERLQPRSANQRTVLATALANAYSRVGDQDRALGLYRDTLVEAECSGDLDSLAHSLNGSFVALCERKRYDEAREQAERYLALAQRFKNPAREAAGHGMLGFVARLRGRHAQALEHLRRAARRQTIAWVSAEMANVLLLLGRTGEAIAAYESAVKQRRAANSPQLYSSLSQLALAIRHDDPQRAEALLDEAIALIESQRTRSRGLSMRQHTLFFKLLKKSHAYDVMAWVQLQLKRPERALEYLERSRGRAVLDLLARSRIEPLDEAQRRARTRGDEATQERIARLRADLAKADRQVERYTAQRLQDALAKARGVREHLLEERGRIVRRLLPIGAPAGIATIRNLLSEGELILYYSTGPSPLLFLVGPLGGEVQAYLLKVEPEALDAAIGRERIEIGRSRGVGQPAKPSAGLFEHLVPAGAWQQIRKAKRIYLIPDGPLHRLPFEMLAIDDQGTTWLDAGPPISYALSGSVLALCQRRRDAHDDVELPHEIVALGGAKFAKGLAPLPGTRREAEAVGSFTLLGERATKQALFEVAGKAKIIHLATHQIADERDSYGYSRLALTGGFLNLYELFEHWRDRLNACELVVLSACESAKGPTQRDEGPYAMPLGFLYAGAPAVIGSLWRVDDQSTAELFVDFYRRLKNGTPKLQAFTEARKALKKRYPQPYHWAAFVYIGDPR